MTTDPPPAGIPSPVSLLSKFNPWMLPIVYVMGGGALSFGGMSVTMDNRVDEAVDEAVAEECPEAEEWDPVECPELEECPELVECEECPPAPECPSSRRRAELAAQLADTEEDLESAQEANESLLQQLTTCMSR
jgi:hypothetical protein